MELHMSENEIVRNYREARDKKTQILILADLNCCSKDTILDVLERNGERVGWFRPKSEEQKEKIRNTRLRANSDDLDKIIEEAHEVEIEVENEPAPVPLAVIESIKSAIESKTQTYCELMNQVESLQETLCGINSEIEELREWLKSIEVD